MMDVRKMASLGQKAMRKQQSKAEKVFWPLQAGRPANKTPNLLEAVLAGRTMANKLMDAMRTAGLETNDSGCMLVFAHENKVAKEAFSRENRDASDLEMARKALKNAWEPIGIAFALWDREKSHLLCHARPFHHNERAVRILSAVLDEWELATKLKKDFRYD
jgi:hypothetical protein